MISGALRVLAGTLLIAAPARQLDPGTATRTTILGSVMEYRRDWIGDTTPFDACQVFRVAGRPSDFPAGIKPPVRRMLDRNVDDPCSATIVRNPAEALPRVVRVDSLAAGDTLAYVYLTVHRGENVHREHYIVRTPRSEQRSAHVKSATLLGGVRMYRAPRAPVRPPNRR